MCENYREFYNELRHYGKEVCRWDNVIQGKTFGYRAYYYKCKTSLVFMVDGIVVGYVDSKAYYATLFNLWHYRFADLEKLLFEYADKFRHTNKQGYDILVHIMLDIRVYENYLRHQNEKV